MRKTIFIVFIIVFFPAACNSLKVTQAAPLTSSPYESLSLSSTPTIETALKQSPATATITPLPTISTFTPTFDVKTIVTVTPSEKAICPKENTKLEPDFGNCTPDDCSWPFSDNIFRFLNSGGSIEKLERFGTVKDLTGDGINELSYVGYTLQVYGCIGGKYEVLFEYEGTQNRPQLDYVLDLNNNNLPELIVYNLERRAFRSIHIFEWNGIEFRPLIEQKFINYSRDPKGEIVSYSWVGGTILNYEITDKNKDGVKEIIAIDEKSINVDPGFYSYGLPWRNATIKLEWNGSHFVITNLEYSAPQYRFQAIQDADNFTHQKKYDLALSLYQDAIFSDDFEWWSKARRDYEYETSINQWFHDAQQYFVETATPFPTLPPVVPDAMERPRLASYAYYRIMLIYFAQGNKPQAEATYETLMQKFSNDQYGSPYAEMATKFWNAYQSSEDMTVACGAAIEYAAKRPSILFPLGSDYHGAQSKIYKPEDVCPFRDW